MKHHKTRYRTLRALADHQLLKEYATFLYYKSFFSNSTYYDYNYTKFGKVVNQSRWRVKRKIDLFIERGWCREHHGNLTFISPDKINLIETGKARSLIYTVHGDTETEILANIYSLLLELKILQCKYAYQKSQVDQDQSHARRKAQKGKIQGVKLGRQVLSNKALREIFGTTPQHVVRMLEERGKLAVERHKIEFVGRYHESDDEHLTGRYFVHEGKLFLKPPNIFLPLTNLHEPPNSKEVVNDCSR